MRRASLRALMELAEPPKKQARLFHSLCRALVSSTGKWAVFRIRRTRGPICPSPILEDMSLTLRGQHMKSSSVGMSGRVEAVKEGGSMNAASTFALARRTQAWVLADSGE